MGKLSKVEELRKVSAGLRADRAAVRALPRHGALAAREPRQGAQRLPGPPTEAARAELAAAVVAAAVASPLSAAFAAAEGDCGGGGGGALPRARSLAAARSSM